MTITSCRDNTNLVQIGVEYPWNVIEDSAELCPGKLHRYVCIILHLHCAKANVVEYRYICKRNPGMWLSLSLSLYIYIYTCNHECICKKSTIVFDRCCPYNVDICVFTKCHSKCVHQGVHLSLDFRVQLRSEHHRGNWHWRCRKLALVCSGVLAAGWYREFLGAYLLSS